MLNIDIQRADAALAGSANQFYQRGQFASQADCGDLLFIAREGVEMAGIVRLCTESGHCVLRGMLVDPARRGRGIGLALLARLVAHLDGNACYALPFRHLPSFYARAGFRPWSEASAPTHLQQRLSTYRAAGLDVLIMKRPAIAGAFV